MSRKQLLHVVAWAAEECERQRSGERSVDWMVRGWDYAMRRRFEGIREIDIIRLGCLVEPRHNDGVGYRSVGVRVGPMVMPPATEVAMLMARLVAHAQWGDVVAADEWFCQYEEIHPFRDGNGRTGSILWNWLRGSLTEPKAPPDFWNEETLPHRTLGRMHPGGEWILGSS